MFAVVIVTALSCAILLGTFGVGAVGLHVPDYRRSEWRHWITVEGCVNVRHFVLRRDSLVPATMSENGCQVVEGEWVGPYTGISGSNPRDFDIDHRVPLGNAHVSGGWAWSREEKRAYANDLEDPEHLVVTTSRANRAKGARGPEAWQPPDVENHCEYATTWMAVKRRWNLTMTVTEVDALAVMYQACSQ